LRNYYGSGSGHSWLDELRCTGYEHSLAECSHSGWGDHDCSRYYYYYYHEVSIICGAGKCSTNTVLFDISTYYNSFSSTNNIL